MENNQQSKKIAEENEGTFLFDEIIVGPIKSRRLGVSLGVNLLPANRKVCNFNCIYCECGNKNFNHQHLTLPSAEKVISELEQKLIDYNKANLKIDSITFAGNGEPTLHPQFLQIIESVITLRNKYYPKTRIAVLSNATRITKPDIFKAFSLIDDPILKMDSAIQTTIEKIDCPQETFNINDIAKQLIKMNGNLVIQTMFLKAKNNNEIIDNTKEEEISEWLKLIEQIRPRLVQIYSISRVPALQHVEKIDERTLNLIAKKVNDLGIKTLVTP